MANFFSSFLARFGFGGPMSDSAGQQFDGPTVAVVPGLRTMTPELAMQVGAIYACVELISNTVSSLPMVVRYTNSRQEARDSQLYFLLHDSPNRFMTPMEFWRAMILQLELKGNAYALIDRRADGDAVSLRPLASDQMQVGQGEDGSLRYLYLKDGAYREYRSEEIFHLKGIGNGVMGLSKLDYMRTSATEAINAQETANNLFGNANKPSGILTVDHVIDKEQRAAIKAQFAAMREGAASGLFVLEDDMHYQALSLTPAETQLLETRKYSVADICRWFGVPAVLIGGDSGTTWGSGLEQIIAGFHRFTLRPLVISIEQALRKQVFSSIQRQLYEAYFDFDELLKVSEKDRYDIYARATQNGLMTRNEVRLAEGRDPVEGGDELTVQSNLVKLSQLGETAPDQTPKNPQEEIGEVRQ